MQSWLTDLPAIQTGMLVVSAVTFHGTGSEARPQPTTRAAAVKSRLRLHWELFLYSPKKLRRLSNVTFPNRRSGSSATDSGNRNLTLSQFLRVKLCCVVLCSHAPSPSPPLAAHNHCFQCCWTKSECFSQCEGFTSTRTTGGFLQASLIFTSPDISDWINVCFLTELQLFITLKVLYCIVWKVCCDHRSGSDSVLIL